MGVSARDVARPGLLDRPALLGPRSLPCCRLTSICELICFTKSWRVRRGRQRRGQVLLQLLSWRRASTALHVIIGTIFLFICLLQDTGQATSRQSGISGSRPPRGTGTSLTWSGCSCSSQSTSGDRGHLTRRVGGARWRGNASGGRISGQMKMGARGLVRASWFQRVHMRRYVLPHPDWSDPGTLVLAIGARRSGRSGGLAVERRRPI